MEEGMGGGRGGREGCSHVEDRSGSKVHRPPVCRREAKVCQIHVSTVLVRQDVLGLDVPVGESRLVARGDGVHDLGKDRGDEGVVVGVSFVGDNLVKQVWTRDEVEDEKQDRVGLDRSLEGDHVRMGRDSTMEVEFRLEQRQSTRRETVVGDRLDG